VDQAIYAELGMSAPTNPYSDQECLERGVFAMINECALALDIDKIVETPNEVDLGMIMGTGFPPFRGGLLKYADSVGAEYIKTQLDKYSNDRKANRLKPTSRLKERAAQKLKFYES
jgi:3-hydroxyacyl-CoA dehydrogenase / enoyl-CoA hydratase / 3-hydroxybutyryl-CoA epimerase